MSSTGTKRICADAQLYSILIPSVAKAWGFSSRYGTEPIVEKEAKSYKLIQVLYTSTHVKMYLNILDSFNNLLLKIENSFLRLYSVAFIHSNHLHYNQTIADKAGDPRSSNRSEILK